MNVVYLHCHDAGRWLEPYDRAFPAPHLMQLAREGTRFTGAHCAAPTCSPSRAALLTGQTAHQSGMLGLAHRGFRLADPTQHLAHYLRTHGYETVLAGVQHEFAGQDPLPYDLRLHAKAADHAATDLANAHLAADFLRNRNQTHAQPFFLSCGFFFPHRDYDRIDAGLDPAQFQVPAGLPDTPEVRRDLAAHATAARAMDTAAGVVLEALRETGRERDTLVVFTTDHGPPFPGMKCNVGGAGTGVILILRGPGVPAGATCEALVSHLDVFPTLCERLALPRPAWLQGHSLNPLFDGSATAIREAVFAEVNFHAAYEPQRGVRTQQWCYRRRFDPRPHPVLPNVDDSPSKAALLAAGWRDQPPPLEQLHDLAADPAEQHNLAADPAYRAPLAAMRARLETWMHETDDPILRGLPLSAPSGAKLNDPAGLSPREPTREVP
jgi:N-sulfoglucosamine sulfohydrolase